jgi:hypothetical protein
MELLDSADAKSRGDVPALQIQTVERKEAPMELLALFVILILVRSRRTKLKIELDL